MSKVELNKEFEAEKTRVIEIMEALDRKHNALNNLKNHTDKIYEAYSEIFEKADHSEEAMAVKEMADMLIGIASIMGVYSRDGFIHPGYVLEKLNIINSTCERQIKYWEYIGGLNND